MKNIWRTGIIFTAAQYLTLAIGFAFQTVVRRQLHGTIGEFGFVQTAIAFTGLLGLPLTIAAQAVTYYIARFHFSGDDLRLHGLLAGCRKFLFWVTVAGSIAAIILIKPLGNYFQIPRTSLTFVALVVSISGLWASYFTVLCQGLGWFKRLALIGLLMAVLRLLFGAITTKFWPLAEWAVLSSAVMLLANLILFLWKKEFPRRTENVISPWTSEFRQFLIVSTAWAFGTSCLSQYDLLVAQRYFSGAQLDNYSAAGLLARQIPSLAGPMLTVLFTHRSSQRHHGDAMREQLKLLGLFAFCLASNAAGLILLKTFGLKLLGQNTPEAVAMITPFSTTMIFVGLIQAIGTWALASRWIKISILYGVLGIGYWLMLLFFGKTPEALLHWMPVLAGIAFAAMFFAWFIAMRLHKIGAPEQT